MENKELYTGLWGASYRDRDRPHGDNYVRVSLHLHPKGSLADWGCGQGRVLKQFQDDGLYVVGTDIADNALDEDVDIPFVCGSVCNVVIQRVYYSMCFDVLEHLDEAEVPLAITNVMNHTDERAYFRIAMKNDFYPVSGEMVNLHKTVKNRAWWLSMFSGYRVVWEKEDSKLIYNIIVEHE